MKSLISNQMVHPISFLRVSDRDKKLEESESLISFYMKVSEVYSISLLDPNNSAISSSASLFPARGLLEIFTLERIFWQHAGPMLCEGLHMLLRTIDRALHHRQTPKQEMRNPRNHQSKKRRAPPGTAFRTQSLD